ncbi:TonB-dependent receptor domain-containing protein [Capnocytophaga gingivalis]|uniref:TonB-dependent receptor domain-containing protein n=1 Tax=Capnocytophaga gingivalis TaxID=1017 RepID=UPI00403DE3DB
MRTIIYCMSLFLVPVFSLAQQATFKGKISAEGKPVLGADVILRKGQEVKGTSSQASGDYQVKVPAGTYKLTISSVGFKTITQDISLTENEVLSKNFSLEKDLLEIDQVVVTATRNIIPQYKSPVVVSKVTGHIFETTQSLSLAEGLNFTPGLRTETNCQNCGFNQLRINGLEGSYSQILVNGRPVFSSLAGVYGLEMIPANMIDRVEVVRGAGSVLYGGNAIGGTVNILTKDPTRNTFSVGNSLSLLKDGSPDNTLFANASVVSDDFDKGLTLFAYQRNRKPYDSNEDGYSEITKLHNTTFGADAFWNPTENSKVKLNLNSINEFRRGGNKFDLLPHESDITEQLRHRILAGDLAFERFSDDLAHKFSLYTSAQYTDRDGYYGGGLGYAVNSKANFDNLSADDQEEYFKALAKYGHTTELVGVGGAQYAYTITPELNLSLGSEYKYDKVNDNYIGQNRSVDQVVRTYGNYLQVEWNPAKKLTLLGGSRYDYVDIKGSYRFAGVDKDSNKQISKFVPRLIAMYDITETLKLRGSFAQGYRAPQAFDEDLHTEVLDGDPIFVELDKDLTSETSNSYTASLNYTKREGNTQANLILEGFYTHINNRFINQDLTDIGNIKHKLKTNATDHLKIMGVNVEANFAFGSQWIWQTGFTYQQSRFSEQQTIWENEDPTDPKKISSDRVMRSPELYGYTTLSYTPIAALKLSYNGVFTGQMYVPHVIEAQSGEQVIVKSPNFYEQNLRAAYTFSLTDNYKLEVFAGVKNIFDQYQKDFDKGKDRDADYIYGPQHPRTYFMGLKLSLN